jgi:hypothetical protein
MDTVWRPTMSKQEYPMWVWMVFGPPVLLAILIVVMPYYIVWALCETLCILVRGKHE